MTTTTQAPRTRSAAARLSAAAGWSAIAIAALHTAVFIPIAPWGDWLSGGLRTTDADHESVAVFWALPGSLVVPTVLMGALMIRIARQGERVGLGYALTLLVWSVGCLWLAGPTGFMLILVTVGLLIAAAVADRRRQC